MPFDEILRQYHHEQANERELEDLEARSNAAFYRALDEARPVLNDVVRDAFATLEEMGRQPVVEYDLNVVDVARAHRSLLKNETKAWITLSFFPEKNEYGSSSVRFPIHLIPVKETQLLHVFGRIARFGGRAEYHHYAKFGVPLLVSGPSGLLYPVRQTIATAIQDMRKLGPPAV